ncbi:hydantoinase/oxoprolinase N-terminal domain-containing protein [Pseudonocardia benzenivorans]
MANSDATLPWWVGVDVGGTFTDVIAMHRHTGETRDHKVLTTRGGWRTASSRRSRGWTSRSARSPRSCTATPPASTRC